MRRAVARDPRVLKDFEQGARVVLELEGAWIPATVSFNGNVRRARPDGGDGPLERPDPQTPARRR